MFGYVKPYVPTLQVQEFSLYRAVYCGLCREMGQVTGQLSRLTLSYDFCFLALLLLAFSDTPSVVERIRCPVHPAKKRAVIASHPALSHTAVAAACLIDGKRLDDLADESGLHRVKPQLEMPLCAGMRARVGKSPYAAFSERIGADVREGLEKLSALEKAGCDSAEETAQCFGTLLGALFADCGAAVTDDPMARTILTECGLRTGRFLYLCDAMDDLSEDVRRARYNPLHRLYGPYAIDTESGRPTELVREGFRIAATMDLTGLGHAITLLPYPEAPYTRILKNIVYAGMPQVARELAAGIHPHTPSPATDAWGRLSEEPIVLSGEEPSHAINLPDDNPPAQE